MGCPLYSTSQIEFNCIDQGNSISTIDKVQNYKQFPNDYAYF